MDQYIVTYKENNKYVTELLKKDKKEIVKEYKDKKFKIDKIIEEEKVDKDTLKKIITDNTSTIFPYGLIIRNHYILCEELFIYYIIDYENGCINIPRLNAYFEDRGIEKLRVDLLSGISIFQTESEYYDGKKFIPLMFKNGFHVKDRTSKEEIREIIKNSTNTLFNLLKPSGKFVYGIYTASGLPLDNYGVIRHCGALWALCLNNEDIKAKDKKERIDKSFEYLMNHCTVNKGNKAFIFPSVHGEMHLGGNALCLLAICEYTERFKDDRYLQFAEKLANGILSCQQPDGRFYHGFNHQLELMHQDIVVYYDGEAVLALLKYYNICKNKIYYEAVLNAFDFFIEKGYENKYDHWIAHALRELMHFNQDDKYITFMNQNCVPKNGRYFAPARLEAIVSLYEAYRYLKKEGYTNATIEDFPYRRVVEGIKFRIENMCCYYIGEEVDLYLKGENVLYGFHEPKDSFRMRIDDIQHSATGFTRYYYSDLDIKNLD